MPKKRSVVGFYKDEKDRTRPVTKSAAELERKKVIQKPRRFKGVHPQTRGMKFRVYEDYLTLLVETDDKDEAIRVMNEAHTSNPSKWHELHEFWGGKYNGIRQYKPYDKVRGISPAKAPRRGGGALLEDQIARVFEKQGYITLKRKNHCDVLAVKPNMALAYLVECKDYKLSRKQQMLAVRELNRNYTHGLELCRKNRVLPEKILKVLVAHGFSYQAKGMYQFTPEEFLAHISAKRITPLSARRKISELETEDARIGERISKLEDEMFESHGKRADELFNEIQGLRAERREITKRIDRVLESLSFEERKKVVREQFAASRVMVETELGGKLTEAEKWVKKRRFRKIPRSKQGRISLNKIKSIATQVEAEFSQKRLPPGHVSEIYAFGSQVRKDKKPKPHSDLDMLLVLKTPFTPKDKEFHVWERWSSRVEKKFQAKGVRLNLFLTHSLKDHKKHVDMRGAVKLWQQ